MPARLFDLYQRKRIININANIIASGVLAIVLAKYPVLWIGQYLGTDHPMRITIAAGVIDMVVDVCMYYALHWLANHWKPSWKQPRKTYATHTQELSQSPFHSDAPPPLKGKAGMLAFIRDASLIQFERVLLSPLYYLIAMGLMYLLQTRWYHLDHSWAFVIGFTSGIVVTRIVHTIWGLKTGLFDARDASHEMCRH